MYNILLACDFNYYTQWGVNCVTSIIKHVPWINVTVVLANPKNFIPLPNVNYVIDNIIFKNESSKIPYYQALRFLKCAEIFSNGELVMSIDCDSVLTKSFSKDEFKKICETIHIQRHQKDIRWMAGLVTYGNSNDFRNRIKEKLLSIPIEDWKYGWDQEVLKSLSDEFIFKKLMVGDWMSFGRGAGTFLTLKGDQKISPGYLENYNNILDKIK